MPERRGIYFAFQGLLVAVLLLLFVNFHQDAAGWVWRFWLLVGASITSLILLRVVDEGVLEKWWFQTGLFIGDALLAFLTLHWSGSNPTLLSLYFLVIFGTAIMRELRQSLAIAAVISILYILSDVHSAADPEFWIGLNFLWVSAGLMALLSRDTKLAQREQEELYQGRLSRLESLATLGQVAGEVAHRIKAPLTTIRVNAEILGLEAGASERARKELREIQNAVERCKSILKDLLDLGRIEEMDFSDEDLRDPVAAALKGAASLFREKNISPVVILPPHPMPVSVDRSLIHEAVFNILHNAIEAVRAGGTISVTADTVELRDSWWPGSRRRKMHRVRIADNGSGIARAELENVFKPFYTTKKGVGSGLGLSAALRILEKHGGSVALESPGQGRGTTATLSLPAI